MGITRSMAVRRPLFALLGALVLLSGVVPLASPAPVSAAVETVWINEIHYDNAAADADEGAEIAGPAGTDLTGWSLVPYNGATGQTYSPVGSPTGAIPAQSNGFGTVWVPIVGLQNGAPDGLALVDPTSTVVQFLSYEGAMTATNGAANGMTSTDIGVSEIGTEALGNSLQLQGTGTSYSSFTWAGPIGHTRGAVNTGQTFPAGTPTLNIADVTQNEGDSSTTTFAFSVSLTSNAGPGGVTFDISTADDTAQDDNPATEDEDYVASSLTGQTIAEGSSGPYTFNVTVNGDTDVEDDERFYVNVTNITGANAGDTQGDGNVTNDDTVTPTDPSGVGAADPSSVVQGGTTTLTVDVTPGGSPPSTGIDVEVDLTDIGGANDQPMLDDGLNGDETAGDNTFTYVATVDPATIPGAKSLPFTISDDEARTGSGNIALTVTQDPCTDPATLTIPQIQGSSTTSPYANTVQTTRGIVTGDFETSATGLSGFFIQDAAGDGNTSTSDGLFIFNGSSNNNVSVGDLVVVSGTVIEFGGSDDPLTEISPLSEPPTICSTGNPLPAATTVTLPEPIQGDLERYEGMRIQITQTLTVQQTFFTARFGQVSLASDGRLFNPTNQFPAASAERAALENENQRRLIFLDDGRSAQNPNPPPYFHAGTNTLRSGDTTSSPIVGFLDSGPINAGSTPRDYRIQPADRNAITFAQSNPRPPAPEAVGGLVQVAAFNVLNYFNTIDETGSPGCYPSGTRSDCRGADSSVEFTRQRDKAINAILGLDADVVGLMELENDGEGASSAIQDLVNGLNAEAGAGTWAFVPSGLANIGGDAIKVALLYQPAVVTLTGTVQIDMDPVHNRPPVAQLFEVIGSGDDLWVVVNHFKSKSTPCGTGGDADAGDGQGCWNATRVAQANRLMTWIDATLAPTDPDVAVIGDLNSYAKEDPILAFEAAGYTNQIAAHMGSSAYSFVFDSYSGYLDHFLTSASLTPRVVDTTEWHINADEPGYIDYNTEFKPVDYYTDEVYRSSDHDPVIAGIFGTANLSIDKEDDPDPVTAGEDLTYTITVTNGGPDAASSAEWTDTLPNGTTFVSLSEVTGWTCTTPDVGAGGTIDCDNESFGVGEAEFTLVVHVAASVANGTVLSNTATVTSSTFDDDTGEESDTALTTVFSDNQLPVAAFTASPNEGFAPLLVEFDASASSDDTGIANYHWDFGDGSSEDTTDPTTTHTYTIGCNCIVTLTVTDDVGATDDATTQVDVIKFAWRFPTRPVPTFNVAIAGSMKPVHFELGGDHGLDVFRNGFPRSRRISCTSGQPVGSGAWTPTSGTTPPLVYDATRDRYTYRWVTRFAWEGTCRAFQVRLENGAKYHTWFRIEEQPTRAPRRP